jgi:Signal transduction histidine kinase
MIKLFYDSRKWLTYFFIMIAVFIVIATVYFSNSLSQELAKEERLKAEIWAEGYSIMMSIEEIAEIPDNPLTYKELENKYDTIKTTLINLALFILERNETIPTISHIYNDEIDPIIQHLNVDIKGKDTLEFLKGKIEEFSKKKKPIILENTGQQSYYNQKIFYDDSFLLKKLMIFPYIQLTVVFVFILISFLALLNTKKAEQNKVWVGLSKETAHQLGTPISSLIAWVEYLKTKDVDAAYLKEMEKDVERLETIADRFSKIGSKPDLLPLNINDAIRSSCDYLSTRISWKVKLNIEQSEEPVPILMNESLFSWVIENLTKNAVDAMEGKGSITYIIAFNRRKVFIDVTDTGKGLSKSKFNTIFNPGYTTKTRGWGLGLSLAKRIIESYPGGKIYVRSSEIGKGTTFRIELKKYRG